MPTIPFYGPEDDERSEAGFSTTRFFATASSLKYRLSLARYNLRSALG
jgi:hypothetical protein